MDKNRRDFLKKAAIVTGAGILAGAANPVLASVVGGSKAPAIQKGGSKKMKLTFKPYETKFLHQFAVSGSSRAFTELVQVQIEYDGVVGYGEAVTPPYLGESQASVVEFLKRVDLSQFSNPFELDDILTYVDNITAYNAAAKASIDIALHDLVGKLLGAKWCDIWGYTAAKAPATSYTIGIDTPEVVRQKTREAAPYSIIKVKLGGEEDKELVKTIREIEPTKPLCVDANQGWKDKSYALDMIYWCKENGFIFVEQPIGRYNLDDMAWITERSPLPTVADESCQRLVDVKKLHGVFSAINIKLMKCTGMREAHKMVELARALDMKIMLGCMSGETSCGISAAAQLSPAIDWADLDGNLLISNDNFTGMKIVSGKITLADLPGVGAVPKKA